MTQPQPNLDDSVAELQRTSALKHLALSDSGFVFDPASGQSFSVNPTGLAVLRHLQQATSADDIVTQLAGEYGIALTQARLAVEHFVQQLRRYL